MFNCSLSSISWRMAKQPCFHQLTVLTSPGWVHWYFFSLFCYLVLSPPLHFFLASGLRSFVLSSSPMQPDPSRFRLVGGPSGFDGISKRWPWYQIQRIQMYIQTYRKLAIENKATLEDKLKWWGQVKMNKNREIGGKGVSAVSVVLNRKAICMVVGL